MQTESIASILNPQTVNLMSAGGGGFDSINSGDLYGVMSACEADPLIWAYWFSYGRIGTEYDTFKLVDYELKKTPIYDDDEVIAYKVRYQEVYKRVHVSNSRIEFSRMLEDWVYHNYLDWIGEKNIYKALEKATTAVEEITEGLAAYLSEDPKRETRIAPFFDMHHQKFKRNYEKFVIKASRILFRKLEKLCNQIDEYTKKEEKF